MKAYYSYVCGIQEVDSGEYDMTVCHNNQLLWKVFDIVDGAPAVPGDVNGDVAYIWMLPSTTSFVILAWLLARTAHASSFDTDLTSAFSEFSYWAYL
ncbi:hypothetical protein AVEN_57898-1 [Araneus ventricosus]|uniref:Uncharacterized protein n=1 Tax=Araneus ventricosus TaxID=182803 RepID=A0A4Y2N6R0_ARAVE|nr:hypothetical protein AVEN_57898-1 [Araneus ventricosus]